MQTDAHKLACEENMAQTTFSGPVASQNGFIGGTATSPITVTTAQNISSAYGSTSATNGDTRLSYNKLTFTAAGSGETLRAYTVLATGAGAVAPGGTVNGAHISLDINGTATVSGAGNALRATLGGSSTNPGGTLAAIQADSNFASGGTWTNASFIRFTNSGTGTVSNLLNVPAAMVATKTAAAVSHTIKIVDSAGKAYYLMVSDTQ
jgi:hypothetical protein